MIQIDEKPNTFAMGMNWRDRLAWAMEDRGFTQGKLAKLTGLAQPRFSLWLKGQGDPSMEEWIKIANALDVPIAWFYEGDGPLPFFRTPEEQQLVRIARQIGLDQVYLTLIRSNPDLGKQEATVPPPSSGPIRPTRTREIPDRPESLDDSDQIGDGRKGSGRKPRR